MPAHFIAYAVARKIIVGLLKRNKALSEHCIERYSDDRLELDRNKAVRLFSTVSNKVNIDNATNVLSAQLERIHENRKAPKLTRELYQKFELDILRALARLPKDVVLNQNKPNFPNQPSKPSNKRGPNK